MRIDVQTIDASAATAGRTCAKGPGDNADGRGVGGLLGLVDDGMGHGDAPYSIPGQGAGFVAVVMGGFLKRGDFGFEIFRPLLRRGYRSPSATNVACISIA